MIVVEQQYPLRCGTRPLQWMIAGQQVVRRQDTGLFVDRYRIGVPPPNAIRPPSRAGRYQDVGEPMAQGVIGRDFTLQADVHVAVVQAGFPIRYSATRRHAARPGRAASRGTLPPSSRVASASITG